MVELHESFSVTGESQGTTMNRKTLTLRAVLAFSSGVPFASAQAESTDTTSFADVAVPR